MDLTNDTRERTMEQALVARVSKQALAKWNRESALQFQELMSYCRCAGMDLEARLGMIGEDFLLQRGGNPVESVAVTLLSPEEIADRMQAGGWPLTAGSMEEHIPDLAAVRAVCAFPSDVYRVADALLKQEGVALLRREDATDHAAGRGYRGLLLWVTVPVTLAGKRRPVHAAVSLRTPAMELWCSAERRFWESGDDYVREQAGEELRECAQLIAEWDQRMEQVRYNVKHRVITK
ncbi:MAG: hypothetical protein IJ705_00685 [Oscillospiraceae bacterium]|nr:hypothetical protein [Oscillospiraceae bacterium]